MRTTYLKKIKTLILLIFFVCLSFSCCHRKETVDGTDTISYEAEIIKVIDGDTIEVQFCKEKPNNCNTIERIRLIGVNTPELNLYKDAAPEYYALEAYYYTKKYTGEKVYIEMDSISQIRDKYSRLLAYVWLCNYTMLNINIIEDGYGYFYDYFEFNPEYMKNFCEAEKKAEAEKKGLWND